jgi:hypothetical protein
VDALLQLKRAVAANVKTANEEGRFLGQSMRATVKRGGAS